MDPAKNPNGVRPKKDAFLLYHALVLWGLDDYLTTSRGLDQETGLKMMVQWRMQV